MPNSYALKVTRKGTFAVPCDLHDHILIFELLMKAHRFAGLLSDETRIKILGDTAYRYVVQDGDLFEGDFLNRFPRVAKAVNFDWPKFAKVDKMAEQLGLPLTREAVQDIHAEARRAYIEFELKEGEGETNVMLALQKLHERCILHHDMYGVKYGSNRSVRAKTVEYVQRPRDETPSVTVPTATTSAMTPEMIAAIVRQVLKQELPAMLAQAKPQYVNGHEEEDAYFQART